MAVRAQYPCNNVFSPDFRTRARSDPFQDQLQMLKDCVDAGTGIPLVGTAVSEHHPKSEMTNNNVAGSRKRSRGDYPSSPCMALPHQIQHPNQYGAVTGPSTCGSPGVVAQDLVTQFYQQSLDVDTIIRFQTERLRSGLIERTKRHCLALVSAMEQQMSKRLKDKETELDSATRWNAELVETVRKLTAENQVWFNVAQNNEAVASSLRAELEHHLLRTAAPPAAAASVTAEEGYGDSDDVQSCCFVGGAKKNEVVRLENVQLLQRRSCSGCGEKEAIVLLLPCRHLCICRDCEPRLDTCPVCNATKNASLNVCMF